MLSNVCPLFHHILAAAAASPCAAAVVSAVVVVVVSRVSAEAPDVGAPVLSRETAARLGAQTQSSQVLHMITLGAINLFLYFGKLT